MIAVETRMVIWKRFSTEVDYYSVCGLPTGDYYVRTYCVEEGDVTLTDWYQDAVPWEGDLPPVHVEAPNETPTLILPWKRVVQSPAGLLTQQGEPIRSVGICVRGSDC